MKYHEYEWYKRRVHTLLEKGEWVFCEVNSIGSSLSCTVLSDRDAIPLEIRDRFKTCIIDLLGAIEDQFMQSKK